MSNSSSRNLPSQSIADAGDRLPAETSIRLTETSELDLSGLDNQQIAELKAQHAAGLIDLGKKAAELKIDVGALDAALGSFVAQTHDATNAGASATISHTQETAIGRTEVMIGNTDKAKSGKIDRSAKGLPDRSLLMVGIVAAVIVIAILVLGN